MGTGLELLPVGMLASELYEQLAKTALAVQDIRDERSFRQLGDFLNSLRIHLSKIDLRAEGSPCLLSALREIKAEVVKAEEIVNRYKRRSFLFNTLNCRSVCESLQKAMRDIGKSLQMLEIGTIEVNDATRNALVRLEHNMMNAEVRVSAGHTQILNILKDASNSEVSDRALIKDVLRKIACYIGLVHESDGFSIELSQFRRDMEDALERKEQQEVQYMEQLMSLLSLADSATALENSQKEYFQFREQLNNEGTNFPINQPPRHLVCDLTQEVMDDPVILCSGRSYERRAINARFEEGNFTDPDSGQPLLDPLLRPNNDLAIYSKKWKHKNSVARILKAKAMLTENFDANKLAALDDLISLCRENTVCKNWIVFEDMIPVILKVVKSQRSNLRVKGLFLLQTVVEDNDHAKDKLFQYGGLKYVLKNSSSLKPRSVRMQAIALLLELIKNDNLLDQFAHETGAILLLVTKLLTGDCEQFRENIEQVLNRLSEKPECLKDMLEANWCKPLTLRLQDESEVTRVGMAKILAEAKLDDSRREALIEAHVIEPLVSILKVEHLETKLASLTALQNLLGNEKAKMQFASLGAVPWVIESMTRGQQIQRSAVAILLDLTTHNGSALLISENGSSIQISELVTSLVKILDNSSCPDLVTNSIKVLWNLAMPSDAHDACQIICSTENIVKIFTLIDVGGPLICEAAMQLLFCLCGKDSRVVSALRDNIVFLKKVVELIKVGSIEVKTAAAGVLSYIPPSVSFPQKIKITDEVFSILLDMLESNDTKAQENALAFLVKFTETGSIEYQRSLIQLNIIQYLQHLLRSGTPPVLKIKACNIVRNISRSTPRLCTESHRKSFKIARRSSINCKVHQVKCNYTFCILEAGIVPDIAATFKDQNADLALAGMEVLETILVENSFQNGVEELYKCNVIEHLFPLFNLDAHLCSEKCVELFEIILKVPDMKVRYGQQVRKILNKLIASSRPSLKQRALQVFKLLTEYRTG